MSTIPGNFVDIFFDLPLLWYNLPLGTRWGAHALSQADLWQKTCNTYFSPKWQAQAYDRPSSKVWTNCEINGQLPHHI
jgi:hypothetical protein